MNPADPSEIKARVIAIVIISIEPVEGIILPAFVPVVSIALTPTLSVTTGAEVIGAETTGASITFSDDVAGDVTPVPSIASVTGLAAKTNVPKVLVLNESN